MSIRQDAIRKAVGGFVPIEDRELRFKIPADIYEGLAAIASESGLDVSAVSRGVLTKFVTSLHRSIKAREARAKKDAKK